MTSVPRPNLSAVLYTRRDCPLCDEMKTQIELAKVPGLVLSLVDVDGDEDLRDRFGWRVPVLEIEGRVAFEGRCEAPRVAEHCARLRADLRAEMDGGGVG